MSKPTTATLTSPPRPWPQATSRALGAPPLINLGLIERLASLAIGAALVWIVTRRLLLNLGCAVVGGYLLYRGVTGYCPLYATEGIATRGWRLRWHRFERSKHHEQTNSTGQMAPPARRRENGMGAPDRQ